MFDVSVIATVVATLSVVVEVIFTVLELRHIPSRFSNAHTYRLKAPGAKAFYFVRSIECSRQNLAWD